jgi:hypothetical protein
MPPWVDRIFVCAGRIVAARVRRILVELWRVHRMAEPFPIVYVRGYAMTANEVEDTFNSPYYGFNLGATQIKLVNRAYDKSDLKDATLRIVPSPWS